MCEPFKISSECTRKAQPVEPFVFIARVFCPNDDGLLAAQEDRHLAISIYLHKLFTSL